jgi:magnesium transporter
MLVLTELEVDRIARERRADEFFWLDLTRPTSEELDTLGELLSLHPVALEDTREFGQRPKVDIYDNHLLIVFYSARMSGETVEPIEVHIYLSGHFAVTVRRTQCAALDDLHAELGDTPTDDEAYLIYKILDTLTDAYYPVIDRLERQIDGLEEQVLIRARREHLPLLYRLRQDVRLLLRLSSGQRDHFMPTAEAIRGLPGLAHGTREFLRDVGDHLVQVAGELQRQSDDLNALTGTYFNANADRLNAVATRLTILGTVAVTWTVFAGFFGQNFGWLVRHINGPVSFFSLGLGLPIGVTAFAGAYAWVKRRDLF